MKYNEMRRRGAAKEEQEHHSINHFIPKEIMMDILSRVHIHSLFQCILVSKAWRDIILYDPIFANLQHDRALENQNKSLSLLFFPMVPYCSPIRCMVKGRGMTRIKLMVMDAKHASVRKWFRVRGSCNGLLCSSYNNVHTFSVFSNGAYVSNPITGEYVMLPFEEAAAISGFGFDSTRKEYKVVRAVRRHYIFSWRWHLEIHTLGTDSWRQVIVQNPMEHHVHHLFSDVLVNGRLHWYSNYARPCRIFSLGMSDEKFGEVDLPVSCLGNRGTTHLMARNGRLALFQMTFRQCLHIWVMKEYNVKESWTKQVNVKWPTEKIYYTLSYWPFDDESFVNELLAIDYSQFRDDIFAKEVVAHVGSLISLKAIMENKGKKYELGS